MGPFKLFVSAEFSRKSKKICKNNNPFKKKLGKALKILEKNPFYGSLSTHKVDHERYGVRYSSWVSGNIRIIWDFADESTIVLLLTIGGHEGKNSVYK